MKITFLGHACFLIESVKGNIIIDPFMSNNHLCPIKVSELPKIDYIIVTHAHGDHFGDAEEIAKKNNALIITMNEFAIYLNSKGIKAHGINFGSFEFPFGKAHFVEASHSSSIVENGNIIYMGNPFGVVLELEKTIYHAGDTGLISDFNLLKRYNIDYAMLPCGGNFTMDIEDFIISMDMIGAKKYIPMHYNTFSLVKQDINKLNNKDNVIILNPGESC